MALANRVCYTGNMKRIVYVLIFMYVVFVAYASGFPEDYIDADRYLHNLAIDTESTFTQEQWNQSNERWYTGQWTYSRLDGVLIKTYPHSEYITKSWEIDGILTKETSVNGKITSRYQWLDDWIISAEYPNGVESTYDFYASVLKVSDDLKVYISGHPENAEHSPILMVKTSRTITENFVLQLKEQYKDEDFNRIALLESEGDKIYRIYNASKNSNELSITEYHTYDSALISVDKPELYVNGSKISYYVYDEEKTLLQIYKCVQYGSENYYQNIEFDTEGRVLSYLVNNDGNLIEFIHEYTQDSLTVHKKDAEKIQLVYKAAVISSDVSE